LAEILQNSVKMIGFDNLSTYSIDFPNVWTFLWSPEEANTIPVEHKDQIFFLNQEATDFVKKYFDSSMICKSWTVPINDCYFKNIEEFKIDNNNEDLKKWLYNRKIPFDKFVFLNEDRSNSIVMMTWKMVIKYCEGIFFSEDCFLFDQSLNWALFYYHEDVITFGSEKIYDKEIYYKKTEINNELKLKFNLK
jgi:hypothetical protein